MALKVGELFASFNLDTSGIDGAVKSAESKMANLGKSLAIGGAAMTAAVTVPIANAAKAIYESGSSFDAEMSKVFAIAGDSVTGSAETMEALRAKALEMGSTTKFTAVEAGEAMEYMAMAGWKSEDMLAAIEPLMNLAAAAGADLGTTSDIVTDAITAFGYSATDMVKVTVDGVEQEVNVVEHFADVLAAASSNSNTNVTMLGESFKFAAPLAGALGYSVDDVAIALGLMANNGIKSSMAGTSLSRIIQNMAKPSDDTAMAMERLGISLYNSRGEAKGLREIMGDFRQAAQDNNVDVAELANKVAELDDQYASGQISEEEYEKQLEEVTRGSGDFIRMITQIAGARGLPGLLAIMNASDEDFDNLCSSIDGATGSAKKMSKVMLDNVAGEVTIFKSAVEGLEITLWELCEGSVKETINKATEYVDAFRKMDKSTQLGALKMGALAAAIGPAMTGMGGLITLLPKLAGTFTAVSGPSALLAIGLLALGAAAIDSNNDIGKTFVKGIKKAGETVRNFGAKAEEALPGLKENMGAFLGSISEGISEGLPGIMDGLGSIITTGLEALAANMKNAANVSQTLVRTLADGVKNNAPKIVPAALELLKNLASALISNVPVVLEGMATVITSLINEVMNADWGAIGSELGTSISTALGDIGTLFKKLIMGDKYTEDAGWYDVGAALFGNIRDGISNAAQNGKDLLGSLVLGDDYDPDESWGTAAGKIWKKITDGMAALLKNAGDLIKGLVLGDGYAADASWGTVADGIWEKIKAAFTALKANTKDLIGTIALGDGYTADSSWEQIGTAIWDKVKEKITALTANTTDIASSFGRIAGEIVTGIAQFIPKAIDTAGNVFDAGLTLAGSIVDTIVAAFGSFNPDLNFGGIVSSLIKNITSAIGGALDLGGKAVDAGTMIVSSLLDSIANAMDDTVSTDGVSEMTGKLKQFAQKLVNGIATLLPKLFETGGKVISAGVKLASELVKSISEGFRSEGGLEIDFAGIAQGLVNGLVEAVKNLPALLGDVLSAGAQIANSIMTSISDALVDTEKSGVGSSLGTALANLVKGLLGAVFDFSGDSNVLGFVQKLGQGIVAALGTIGQTLGSFVGELLKYLFSSEGLTQVFNAGASLIKLIIEGMKSAVGGIVSFFTNMVDEILISWGIIDVDAKEAAEQARDQGEALTEAANQAFNDALSNAFLGEGEFDKDFKTAALLALFGGRTGDMNKIVSTEEFAGELSEWFELAEAAINASIPNGTKVSFEDWAYNLWETLGAAVEGEGGNRTISADTVKSIMAGYLEPFGIAVEDLSDEIWESVARNVATGGAQNSNELWDLLLTSLIGSSPVTGAAEETAEKAADTASEAVENTLQQMGITAAEAAEETKETITEAFDGSANGFAQSGMAGALADGTAPVSDAALEVSDTAVKQFLLTMSAENGTEIGNRFIGGIITVLADGTLVATAETLGTDTSATLGNILTEGAGSGIGQNFGAGLGNGIASMTGYVTSCAYDLGLAAAAALSAAIQEGSPSRLTAKTGTNFGLGFINAIQDSVSGAENAAKTVGLYAASALNGTVSRISSSAADQMSLPGNNYRSEADRLAAENEKTAGAYASAIADALSGAKVVMNGELVGELVTDTVSEGIASRMTGKRYGTV